MFVVMATLYHPPYYVLCNISVTTVSHNAMYWVGGVVLILIIRGTEARETALPGFDVA